MRLKNIRLENNLIQNDIAKIIDVKRNTYAMWELEHDKIPLLKLITIAEHFNTSIDYLLELTNTKQYPDSNIFNKNLYLERIKTIRKQNKYTQEKLAKKLHTTNSVISRYESGETFIITSFLIEYSRIFNISADYLLGKINIPLKINSNKN